jgi:hypothetical protein
MTRLYLDTEFNGFGGALMSIALVSEVPGGTEFYRVVEHEGPITPWVAEHVVPYLRGTPRPRVEVARDMADALSRIYAPVIVADWPSDFEHLLGLLITGPGQMVKVPDFGMDFRALPGFNTADHSLTPHNALADARALRDYCEGNGKWVPHA